MDGNGRWANLRGLPRIAGHRAGAESLRAIVKAAPPRAIGLLTAYAFSSDNWKRPAAEVDAFMSLLAVYLEAETPRLIANGVRLSIIGRRDRLPARLVTAIETAEWITRVGTGLHLQLAIDYSSRETILRTMQLTAGAPVTLDCFAQMLCQSKPVDLLIRTGGEQRLSDFLLWECAYAELIFTTCMWPDFGETQLRLAVDEFHRRTRKFGAIPPAAIPEFQGERWLR